MNIITNTVAHSNAAVDRFSDIIRNTVIPVRNKIYLNAFLSVPSSLWNFANIIDTDIISAIFATSEGWNWKNPRSIHLLAPLVMAPCINTTSNKAHETGSSIFNFLNHLHGMRCVKKTMMVPAMIRVI